MPRTSPLCSRRQHGGDALTLSRQLSIATRAAHGRAEQAFALQDRLTGLPAYAGLLHALRSFHRPAERAVVRARGWDELTPAVDVAARRRAHLLDDDLAALGVDTGLDDPAELGAGAVVGALPTALGWLYVLEGSALGGKVVAREARRRLGEDLPVAFLTSASRVDVAADWRVLRAALDAFGRRRPRQEVEQCVHAATECFTVFTTRLEREVVPT